MTIAYRDFEQLTQGRFNESFQFGLSVFRDSFRDININLLPQVNISLSWLKVFRPSFDITTPTRILVAQDNILKL
jgi:hypothetical protein